MILMSLRQYEPIWQQLKTLSQKDAESLGVSVTANRLLHSRIIKAVKKEKWMDFGWKVSVDPLVAELEFTSNHSILTIRLIYKLYDSRMKTFTEHSF